MMSTGGRRGAFKGKIKKYTHTHIHDTELKPSKEHTVRRPPK